MDRRKLSRPSSWRASPRPTRSGPDDRRPSADRHKTGSFDEWLDHRLKEMYGAVVEEPLPDELRALVERLSREDGAKDDGGKDDDRNK